MVLQEGGGVYIDKKFTTSPELFVALDSNSDGLLVCALSKPDPDMDR